MIYLMAWLVIPEAKFAPFGRLEGRHDVDNMLRSLQRKLKSDNLRVWSKDLKTCIAVLFLSQVFSECAWLRCIGACQKCFELRVEGQPKREQPSRNMS